ncbi:uncharacterized protein ColSpa_07974 [Colletotrichum spaethianum]|uniref:Secreted protein n=1 Tax=Colletotrichum spaethianum TaxID=700344 RepID=A0AA37URD0_9PEZI|nr:uncharacterized protein ColSpa_07974 [Colletotrichum spaethianum]GKT47793.1 hypothetical protein ColSpa_07974 [Colletotrichum spaethianum]
MRFILPFLCLGAASAVAQDPLAIPDDFDVEQGEMQVVKGDVFNITFEEFGDTSFDNPLDKRGAMRGTMTVGKTYMDYGCDASIRKTLDQGIRALCDGNGCDGGSTWSRKVQHSEGHRPADATISVRVEAVYKDGYALNKLREGVLESVRPDTTKPKNINWSWRQPGGWEVLQKFAADTRTAVDIAKWVFENIVGPAATKKVGDWIGKVSASQQK